MDVLLLEGKKYKIIREDMGRLKFYRYNEPWPAAQEGFEHSKEGFEHSKLIHSMVDRIIELENQVVEFEKVGREQV